MESDKDRLLLIQEKEQLLRELRSITPKSRSDHEMAGIRAEINKLEQDLSNAMEDSNRCIADRLRLHEDKQLLLQQLRDWLRTMSQLESQLRVLSSSSSTPAPGGMMCAAMSSSASSLGSLSSSHASSKGSLSSLSFTDIYGLSTTTPADPAMLDLHRRVDKILSQGGLSQGAKNSQMSTPQIQTPHRQSITELTSIEEVASPTPSIVEQLQQHHQLASPPEPREADQYTSNSSQPLSPHQTSQQNHRQQLQMPSQLSLSPRSSLSSVSPPVSPHVDFLLQSAAGGGGALPKQQQQSSLIPQRYTNYPAPARHPSSSDGGPTSKLGGPSSIKTSLTLECNNQSTPSSSLPSPSSPSLNRKNYTSSFHSSAGLVGGAQTTNNICGEGLSPICERRILESSSSAISNTPSSSNASNVRSSVVSVAAR